MIEEPLTIPHAPGPEKAVLSVLMKYPKRMEGNPLDDAIFHLPAHRTIYREMRSLAEPVELISFIENLRKRNLLESIGGHAAVTEIYTYAPNDAHLAKHLAEIKECHRARETIALAARLIDAAHDRGNPERYLAELAKAGDVMKMSSASGDASFPVTSADDMEAGDPARDFVEGLLTEGSVSVIYGASNVGKSFWTLDLAAHVATGKPWGDAELEVDQGAVVYVALEGTGGMRNRIEAMKREGILPPGSPFYVCFSPVSLLDASHGPKLAETVKTAAAQANLPCKLVVLDTLARAMAGGNENAGEDMTAAVATIDAVKQATGAHIAIVHHCGKDEAKGARGHSSLRAAVDTEIEVFRPEGEHVSTVRVTKQRDLEPSDPMPFSLRVIELGKNHRGKPVTSCVVKHEDGVMASQPKAAGRKATYIPEKLLEYLPAANATDWQKRAKVDCGVSNGKFYELKAVLQQRGAYRSETGTGRLVRA